MYQGKENPIHGLSSCVKVHWQKAQFYREVEKRCTKGKMRGPPAPIPAKTTCAKELDRSETQLGKITFLTSAWIREKLRIVSRWWIE